ncbi:MAG: hypothetical protein OSB57_01735 [Planctomycetota bacterium]|nr:hypothetical protein [Planctomycetota bacterium]
MPWAALALNVGASAIGGHKARKAQRQAKKDYLGNIKGLGDLIRGWTQSGNALLAEKGGLLEQMLSMSQAGGQRAEAAVGSLGQSAYRRINEREQQSLGAMNSGLAQRGLYNTTVGANLQRGIQADSNRAFGEVDEGLAGLRSSLIGQNTNRNMGALGMLANNKTEQLGFGSSQNTNLVNLLAHQLDGQQMSQSTGWGQMGSELGGLIGGLFTGGNSSGPSDAYFNGEFGVPGGSIGPAQAGS